MLARYGDKTDIQQLIDDKVGPKAPYSSAAAMALALQRACDRPAAAPTPAATTPGTTPTIDPTRSRVDLQDLLEHLDPDDLKAASPSPAAREEGAPGSPEPRGPHQSPGPPLAHPDHRRQGRDRQQQDRRLGFLASDHRRCGADPRRVPRHVLPATRTSLNAAGEAWGRQGQGARATPAAGTGLSWPPPTTAGDLDWVMTAGRAQRALTIAARLKAA